MSGSYDLSSKFLDLQYEVFIEIHTPSPWTHYSLDIIGFFKS